MVGSYDWWLVVLSVLMASLASYTALHLASRVAASAGRVRTVWLVGGAVAMGVGIWSMHFIGMLAFRLPAPMTYRVPQLLLSVLVAILASAFALSVVGRPRVSPGGFLVAAVGMGAAIAGMHYIGMWGLHVPASLTWHRGLVAGSIAIAIMASLGALLLAFRFRGEPTPHHGWQRGVSGVVMGLAIAGMHYTAMAAARFGPPHPGFGVPDRAGLATTGLAGAVIVSSLMILGLALLGAMGDQWVRAKTAETAALQEREQILQTSNAALERSQAALRRTSATLRAVVESSPLPIIACNHEGAVQSWNLAAERLFGWREAEVLGQRPPFVRPEQADEIRHIRDQVLTHGPVMDLEVTRYKRDETPVTLSLSVAPLHDEPTATVGTIAIAVDITERKRMIGQFAQAQKMEAMGQLAAGVAHDFNNILTAIGSYAEFLRDELPTDDPRAADVEGIREAADRATALTQQLLAFSRRQVIRPEPLDVNGVVAETIRLAERLVPSNIRISMLAQQDVGGVSADRGQLSQVLLNLVINARDAMPDGGTLVVETTDIELDAAYASEHLYVKPGAYVVITVSDTGVGMDEVTRARIFEPFFTTKPAGTGLGLATVFGIVRQAGGHVFVYSELGTGSTFKVYLPRLEAGERAAARSEPDRPRLFTGSETVLLVDDDAVIRTIAARALRASGYQVLEATSPGEALLLVEREGTPIALLVTDIMMPLITGHELAERVQRLRPGARVLYMSGYTENSVIRRGVLQPDVAFLAKPFTPDSLVRSVRAALDAPALGSDTRVMPAG
jgi:PAS domain S-box-containing protein